jgi:hypothetical protein
MQGAINMTQSELIKKLEQAQDLLSDVYHWADAKGAGELKVSAHVASLMSCADDCIIETIDYLTGENDE